MNYYSNFLLKTFKIYLGKICILRLLKISYNLNKRNKKINIIIYYLLFNYLLLQKIIIIINNK